MTEKLNTKEIKQSITSPVLKTLLGHEEVKACHYGLEGLGEAARYGVTLRDFEVQRNTFIGLSNELNLSLYRTTSDIVRMPQLLGVELLTLPRRMQLEKMLELKKAAQTGAQLIDYANKYITIQMELAASGLPVDALEGSVSNDVVAKMTNTSVSKQEAEQMHLPHLNQLSQLNTRYLEANSPLEFIAIAEGLTGYRKEAADFARYIEAIVAGVLFGTMAFQLEDVVGKDVRTGKPVLFEKDVHTVEEVERRTRLLPPELARWTDRGLMQYASGVSTSGFYNGGEKLRQIIITALPQGMDDSTVQVYLQAEQDRKIAEGLLLQEESSERRHAYDQARDEEWKHLLAVKRRIFDESIKVFSDATEPLYPDIEKQARRFAKYTIRTNAGAGGLRFDDSSPYFNADEGKPLAHSVASLRQAAYETGVYLDPLKAEIDKKLLEGGYFPTEIARMLEAAFQENQQRGLKEFSKTLTSEKNWFLREAFFTASSLDREGAYQAKNPDGVVPRAPEVVQDIIDYLHSFGGTK